MASRQMLLPLELPQAHVFDSFHSADNRLLVDELQRLIAARRHTAVLYLYGPGGSGKSHLLHACCHQAGLLGRPSCYLSLHQHHDAPASVQQLQPPAVVCIDNFEQLRLRSRRAALGWQHAALSLYERLVPSGGALVVAAAAPLPQLDLQLADLASRIRVGGVYRLQPLSDPAKRLALQDSARRRGFALSEAVLNFIMTHYQRDTAALFSLLDKLDCLSLVEQRKITVPLVKTLL